MSLQLGDKAPDFHTDSTLGLLDFHAYLGSQWGLLLSHPADFTPVCTTELGALAGLQESFLSRNVKVLVLSVDPLQAHHDWKKDICDIHQMDFPFPLLADPEARIAALYGMIHPAASDTQTVRSLFLIDPSKTIRLTMTYPASTGRNFHEVLRVLDALQRTDAHQISTPAGWQPGDAVIIPPAVSDEKAAERFGKNIRMVRPYLRFVPDPDAPAS